MQIINVKKSLLYFLIVMQFALLLACSQSPDFELYEGKALSIAIVGEPPELREDNISFSKVSLDELANKNLDSFNAVLIMEEHLTEAAESQYTDIYLNSTIPFFFISAQNHIPFTEKDTEYNDSWDWTPGNSYATGVLKSQKDDSLKGWGFGLYNDKKNEENIKEMYSRIFKNIEESEIEL